jgi:hypothetical protein
MDILHIGAGCGKGAEVNLTVRAAGGDLNLQATLSLSSVTGPDEPIVKPHHPITCSSSLRYEEDGTFACGHASVPPDDARTQSCLDHTVALLLLELVQNL